jgi:hypothetical protein
VLNDPVLGRMSWNAERDSLSGEVDLLAGQRIDVLVFCNEEVDVLADVLSRARQWLERVRRRDSEYRQWAAERLVHTRWNKDEPMTARDICELLQVATLECNSDGTACVYWDDNDLLFYGNNLYSRLDASGECIEVAMD